MKTLWRVENGTGEGMYSSGDCESAVNDLYGMRHPGPWNDTVLGYCAKDDSDSWQFGFATLAQYQAWVYKSEFREALAEAGMRLSKYQVPDDCFERSSFQCIYRTSSAVRIDERACDYLEVRRYVSY